MIPKEAIHKALEAGWDTDKNYHFIGEIPHEKWTYQEFCEIALDPTFWQALGKALTWNEKTLKEAPHYFYDIILQNGGNGTEAFWKDLLAKENV